MNNHIYIEKSELCIMSTGGTIEKTYDEEDGALKNIDSRLKEILVNRLRLPHTKIDFKSIMAKDSLNMTMRDREEILNSALRIIKKDYPVVILHGTDTLAVTAEHFFNKIKNPVAPIIFTGAMKPMGFVDSDAPQNITEAILCTRILNPGIYVSFHGRVFKIPNLVKNKQRGTFEGIDNV